jgi:hypothetical protein
MRVLWEFQMRLPCQMFLRYCAEGIFYAMIFCSKLSTIQGYIDMRSGIRR